MDLNEKLEQVCRLFRIEDTYLGYETIQMGNVNHTYKVNFRLSDGTKKSFLVQNVNTYAFRDPVGLMDNIDKVTGAHPCKIPQEKPACISTTPQTGRPTSSTGITSGRMTNYIPSVTYNTVKDPMVLRNAGLVFGEFQEQLSDFDINSLKETIPGFHNTRQRYAHFKEAVAQDKAHRAGEAQEEIRFLLENEDLACTLTDLHQAGKLPLRVTHNDTKINNVLFSPEDHSALVVIDLDTVMPGLMGHDFGDAIRFAANRCEEDCPDPGKAGVDMEVFRSFAEGFLEKTAHAMTQAEADTLAISCFCLTAELAVRFWVTTWRATPISRPCTLSTIWSAPAARSLLQRICWPGGVRWKTSSGIVWRNTNKLIHFHFRLRFWPAGGKFLYKETFS